MDIEHELAIARPREDVFDLLVDWSRHPEWVSGLVSSEADGARAEAGQGFKQQLEHGPLRIDLEGRVTDLAAPEQIACEAQARDVRLVWRFELEGTEDGTRLRQRTTVSLESFMLKMMASRVKSELESKQAADLARLKALLES
ncbi:MAG: SRPBCC family protein [Planctomycetota bacterium]|jgi:uncharacterized protein YndB with AHSA1/START domain